MRKKLRSSQEAAGPTLSSARGLSANAAMKIETIVNSTSGTVLRLGVDNLKAALDSAFSASGIEAVLKFVPCEELRDAAASALLQAKSGEIDALVVGGGDGTVRTVAAILAGSGIPLGILPLGTLNHFAKDLGIPLELDSAAAVIAKGSARTIDVAEVNGEVFINNSSIGIYPYMVLDRERRRAETGHPKWIAMMLAFFRMLRQFPRRRLAVCSEGWAQPYRTPCLFIANNQYTTQLFALGKRENLDRGELWLYIVKQRHPLAFLWLAMRTALGLLDESRDIETLQVRAAEIRSRASRLLVALDGEVEALRPPLRYRTRPGGLRVLTPAPAET